MSTPAKPYLANGRVLQTPPLATRVRGFFDGAYDFLGLYMNTLFTLDPYAAAQMSPHNIRNRSAAGQGRATRGGLGGGGGGGGPGSGGPGGGGGKKIGRIYDGKAPDCNRGGCCG